MGGPARGRKPIDLDKVPALNLEPLKTPIANRPLVGDGTAWQKSLRDAFIAEHTPLPTIVLNPEVVAQLDPPGQVQSVQTALTTLQYEDGIILGNATGSGKTYIASAIMKEFERLYADPNLRILYITKNKGLLRKVMGVAHDKFGLDMREDRPLPLPHPDAKHPPGKWITTYARLRKHKIWTDVKWDLVIADESGEARRWYNPENKQGNALIATMRNAKKGIYVSATPFHSPLEYGYLEKLNLWKEGKFYEWLKENKFEGIYDREGKMVVSRLSPHMQAKLRQQLIERGQFISQSISYEGLHAHFGVVPMEAETIVHLRKIQLAFDKLRQWFAESIDQQHMVKNVSAFQATYTKAFLERSRLKATLELARRGVDAGYQVLIYAENGSEDLFHKDRVEGALSRYQEIDDALRIAKPDEGGIREIIPPMYDVFTGDPEKGIIGIRDAFPGLAGDFSGRGKQEAPRNADRDNWLKGQLRVLFSTYASGGIGIDLHDTHYPELGVTGGNKPRLMICMGPPYSGMLFDQTMGRPWRVGVLSDAHIVFLAGDSKPDMELLNNKTGPRLDALQASVHGRLDPFAEAIKTYSAAKREGVQAELMDYVTGGGDTLRPEDFTERLSERQVRIKKYSQLEIPHSDTAKGEGKGMRYKTKVVDPLLTPGEEEEPGILGHIQGPDNREEMIREMLRGILNSSETGNVVPPEHPLNQVDPTVRDNVVRGAVSAAQDEARIPVDRDPVAAAQQSVQGSLLGQGDSSKWRVRYETHGVWPFKTSLAHWDYTGDKADIKPTMDPIPPQMKKVNPLYWGFYSMEQATRSLTRKLGIPEVGDKIVKMTRDIGTDETRWAHTFYTMASNVMSANKLNPKKIEIFSQVFDVMNGRGQSANPNINAAADGLRDVVRHVIQEKTKLGLPVHLVDGKVDRFGKWIPAADWIPREVDWDAYVVHPTTGEKHTLKEIMGGTFSEIKRAQMLQEMATRAKVSVAEMVSRLDRQKRERNSRAGLYRDRPDPGVPILKQDWWTFVGFLEDSANQLATFKHFGHPTLDDKIGREIGKIHDESVRDWVNTFIDGVLTPEDWSDKGSRLYNGWVAYETFSKMMFSVAKVPFHLVHASLSMGGRVMPVGKAIARVMMHPWKIKDEIAHLGALMRQMNYGDTIGTEAREKGAASSFFRLYGFKLGYKWARVIAADSARVYMDQYALNDLRKGGKVEAETRRMLSSTMLATDHDIDEALRNNKWSDEAMQRAVLGFTNFAMFDEKADLQMPYLARINAAAGDHGNNLKRAVRLMYSLQSFAMKTQSLLKEKLWDEVVRYHNPKPLGYFLLAYPVVGEMLRASSAFTRGIVAQRTVLGAGIQGGATLLGTGSFGQAYNAAAKAWRDHDAAHDAWDRYIDEASEVFRHPALGGLRRVINDMTYATAMDRVRTLTDPLLELLVETSVQPSNKSDMERLKKSRASVNHMMEDLVENTVGAAYTSMLVEPLIAMGREITIMTGMKTRPEVRHHKEAQAALRWATEEMPLLGNVRKIQHWMEPPKRPRKRTPGVW